ncbi:MAG: hypothetical protein Q4F23_04255 [Coriobacteriia bacterium]|nr:hypothetical protein [Coriobacteriia bacterium]
MSYVSRRLSQKIVALAAAAVLAFGFGCAFAGEAHALNSVDVTKAPTASSLKSETSSLTYKSLKKVSDSGKGAIRSYQVGSLWCTTNSSFEFSKVFSFAADNDSVTIKGEYVTTDDEASKPVTKGAINACAIDSIDKETVTGSFADFKKQRIVLSFAASAESDKAKAEEANKKLLKKGIINSKYAPALFLADADNPGSYKIFRIKSITLKDSAYSAKYASAKVEGSSVYTGGDITPNHAFVYYCGSRLSASAAKISKPNAGTHKTSVTATVDGHQISVGNVPVTIEAAPLEKVVLSYGATTYDGSYKKPSVKVYWDCNGSTKELKSGYRLTYANNLNAGTGKVMVTGTGNYKGAITKTFTIKKKPQSFTVDTSIKKESYNSTLGANHSTAKYRVKGAKGKVTFTKVGGSKRLKVNGATSCRLMVKKGTPKGVYSAKIRVTAAESGNYAKTSKVVTLKVRLK